MLKGRTEALLSPLAPTVAGTVADGALRGTYQGYSVEARTMRHRPSPNTPNVATGGTMSLGPRANIFEVKLVGAPGRRFWNCRSVPTPSSSLVPEVFTKLVYRLIRSEFKFERPRAERLMDKLGMPAADPEVQERLQAAGLFEQLSFLRWGTHPYLPKVTFNPHGQALSEGRLSGLESTLKEMVRARGNPEFESAIDAKLAAFTQEHPGELAAQVEAGKPRVPNPDRFRELLDVMVRVAEINAHVNA